MNDDVINKLWNLWLQSKSQPMPGGQMPFRNVPDYYPQSMYMKPQDINRYINAQDVWDLISGSDPTRNIPLDYPTIALNLSGFNDRPKVNLFSSEYGSFKDTFGRTMDELLASRTAEDGFPKNLYPYMSQAIQTHENKHFETPPHGMSLAGRPQWNNKGYLNIFGSSPEVFKREVEPMLAEDRFWEGLGANFQDRLKALSKYRDKASLSFD